MQRDAFVTVGSPRTPLDGDILSKQNVRDVILRFDKQPVATKCRHNDSDVMPPAMPRKVSHKGIDILQYMLLYSFK